MGTDGGEETARWGYQVISLSAKACQAAQVTYVHTCKSILGNRVIDKTTATVRSAASSTPQPLTSQRLGSQ